MSHLKKEDLSLNERWNLCIGIDPNTSFIVAYQHLANNNKTSVHNSRLLTEIMYAQKVKYSSVNVVLVCFQIRRSSHDMQTYKMKQKRKANNTNTFLY